MPFQRRPLRISNELVGMTIAEVDDEASETGAENGRLGETRGGFGGEAEEEDAQGDVDAASADSAGGGHSGGEEPDDGRRYINPQKRIMTLRVPRFIVCYVKQLPIVANPVIGIAEQIPIALGGAVRHLDAVAVGAIEGSSPVGGAFVGGGCGGGGVDGGAEDEEEE
mmetsp:Transcript_7375/g.15372  ORF Transcript_7375/g.15372 Transcript_7375/m.15372 type:complete len:167 (-) Transcript_7375:23-523(-)